MVKARVGSARRRIVPVLLSSVLAANVLVAVSPNAATPPPADGHATPALAATTAPDSLARPLSAAVVPETDAHALIDAGPSAGRAQAPGGGSGGGEDATLGGGFAPDEELGASLGPAPDPGGIADLVDEDGLFGWGDGGVRREWRLLPNGESPEFLSDGQPGADGELGAAAVAASGYAASGLSSDANVNDSVPGSVSVHVERSGSFAERYRRAQARSARVTVADDDVLVVSVAASHDVAEGDAVTFELTTDLPAAADTAVSVTISAQGGYVAADDLGTRTVTFPAGVPGETPRRQTTHT